MSSQGLYQRCSHSRNGSFLFVVLGILFIPELASADIRYPGISAAGLFIASSPANTDLNPVENPVCYMEAGFSATSSPANTDLGTIENSICFAAENTFQSPKTGKDYSLVQREDLSATQDTIPDPSHVLRKSLILPGWGQLVNEQKWKIPVIYGVLAGLTYYSIHMNRSYRDYRAAYYNRMNPDGDFRFGPTPGYIDAEQSSEFLRYARNEYRNRRDLTFVVFGLAYGLNILDAYVFAHMRDFDVSDQLSANIRLGRSDVSTPISHGENSSWSLSPVCIWSPVSITMRWHLP